MCEHYRCLVSKIIKAENTHGMSKIGGIGIFGWGWGGIGTTAS